MLNQQPVFPMYTDSKLSERQLWFRRLERNSFGRQGVFMLEDSQGVRHEAAILTRSQHFELLSQSKLESMIPICTCVLQRQLDDWLSPLLYQEDSQDGSGDQASDSEQGLQFIDYRCAFLDAH